MTTVNLSINTLRRLALMQHLGEDFFILEDDGNYTAYLGNEDDARDEFEEEVEGTDDPAIDANFRIFCDKTLVQVEELEEDDYSIDYLVLTDEEADQKWDEYLDSYIDECITPQLEKLGNNFASYFDDEKWKKDARVDGRGHSLATYDGHENVEVVEGETFYIFRTN